MPCSHSVDWMQEPGGAHGRWRLRRMQAGGVAPLTVGEWLTALQESGSQGLGCVMASGLGGWMLPASTTTPSSVTSSISSHEPLATSLGECPWPAAGLVEGVINLAWWLLHLFLFYTWSTSNHMPHLDALPWHLLPPPWGHVATRAPWGSAAATEVGGHPRLAPIMMGQEQGRQGCGRFACGPRGLLLGSTRPFHRPLPLGRGTQSVLRGLVAPHRAARELCLSPRPHPWRRSKDTATQSIHTAPTDFHPSCCPLHS